MPKTFESYMTRRPGVSKEPSVPCVNCEKLDVTGNMISVRSGAGDPDWWCLTCWNARNRDPNAKPYVPPATPVDSRSAFGATAHKTFEAASERRAKVALHLGVIPDVFPRVDFELRSAAYTSAVFSAGTAS